MESVAKAAGTVVKSALTWNTPIHYKPYEHFCMKFLLVTTVYFSFASSSCKGTDRETLSLRPNGLGQYFDLSWVCYPTVRMFWDIVFILASALFLAKRFTYASICVLTVMDISFFTMKNSKGWIGHSNQISSFILLTHFLYYTLAHVRNFLLQWKDCPGWLSDMILPYEDWYDSLHTPNLSTSLQKVQITEEDMAVFYSQQAIASTYIMAAISKYQKSTGNWMAETQNIVIQVIKANQMEFFNRLKPGLQENAFAGVILGFCVMYPFIAQLAFGGGLYLEFFAFLALFNRVTLLFGGLILWTLHQGILIMMRLDFYKNQKMLVAYYINIPYWAIQSLLLVTNALHHSNFLNIHWKGVITKLRSLLNHLETDTPATPTRDKRRFSFLGRQSAGSNRVVRLTRLALHKVPWKFMIVITLFCYNIQEWYPFSHFPMYASNTEETDFLFVTDHSDKALPFATYFSARTTSLRKYFRYVRRQCLDRREDLESCTLKASNSTLAHFYEEAQSLNDRRAEVVRQYFLPLKLWMRIVHLWANGTITTDDSLVAVYPPSYAEKLPQPLSFSKPLKSSKLSLERMLIETAPEQPVVDMSLFTASSSSGDLTATDSVN